VVRPGTRRIGGASRHPSIRAGIVLTARVEITIITTTPDDHLAASPHCGMPVSPRRGIASAGICPTVRDRIIFAATVKKAKRATEPIPSTPDDHFAAGPDCSVAGSGSRRIGSSGRCPGIRAGIVFSTGIEGKAYEVDAAPDNHLTASPHCGMAVSASGRIGGASSGPTVRDRIVSPAGIVSVSTPDDHFSASPNSCVAGSRKGRASGAGVGPTIGGRTVSAASVQIKQTITRSAPDDHFSAGPHYGVIESISGRVRAASGCPGTINATS
jgi:hypothetical protein